ncbi:YtxH domain-containing protein [Pseudogracilibacillus sp. SO30301A]|uniref:YtxH domain-containing protein n=1 Tax=Pseudogracilibacillus sp. SO30301A TaxID=3098291 RepID=UPI00300DD935
MGKRTLLTGIIAGASIGGLLSLLNKDARKYAKETLSKSRDNFTYYVKNPTDAVEKIRHAALTLNNMIESNTSSAVNALEQVENSLNKVTKK